ncbi:LolP protein [Xylariaceae sp. FL1272]|nr:LolP protein [Xylariaceae sp. FL1272]
MLGCTIANRKSQGSFMRHGLAMEDAMGELPLILFAGSDTTDTVIRSTMLYIMLTPRVYSCLKATIRQAVTEGQVSKPISYKQAKDLPYLQAVLKEGFRMRPPFISGHYKKVPPGGETLKGVFLPGGTALGHNTAAMMRRSDIFGPDVETFRPERWIDCDEEDRARMEHTIDIVFGGGRWMCTGKQIAWTQVNKVVFELLRAFDFQPVNAGQAWHERSYFLWMQKDFWVNITEAGH